MYRGSNTVIATNNGVETTPVVQRRSYIPFYEPSRGFTYALWVIVTLALFALLLTLGILMFTGPEARHGCYGPTNTPAGAIQTLATPGQQATCQLRLDNKTYCSDLYYSQATGFVVFLLMLSVIYTAYDHWRVFCYRDCQYEYGLSYDMRELLVRADERNGWQNIMIFTTLLVLYSFFFYTHDHMGKHTTFLCGNYHDRAILIILLVVFVLLFAHVRIVWFFCTRYAHKTAIVAAMMTAQPPTVTTTSVVPVRGQTVSGVATSTVSNQSVATVPLLSPEPILMQPAHGATYALLGEEPTLPSIEGKKGN